MFDNKEHERIRKRVETYSKIIVVLAVVLTVVVVAAISVIGVMLVSTLKQHGLAP